MDITKFYTFETMNCRHLFQCCLTAVMAVVALQPCALAQSTTSECQATLYQIFYYPQDKIPTLRASDIISAPEGSDGLKEQFTNQEEILSGQLPIKSDVILNVQRFWWTRVQNSDLQFLKSPKYTVNNGGSDGNPFNRVIVRPLGDIEQVASCQDNTVVVRGGITLIFSNFSAVIPGDHSGRIQMCVATEKSGCP